MKSKTPSGGMSGLPPKPPLFIDRNSGGRTFRALIEKQGIAVKLHDEHFGIKTGDEVWLKEIGERGWTMITGDAKITRSPLFLLRLTQSTARVFILKGLNGATPEGKAAVVVSFYEKIAKICQENAGPLLWKFNKDGSQKAVDFKKHLEKMKRHRRV